MTVVETWCSVMFIFAQPLSRPLSPTLPCAHAPSSPLTPTLPYRSFPSSPLPLFPSSKISPLPRVRLLRCGFPAAIIDRWEARRQKLCAVPAWSVMGRVIRPWGATCSHARNAMGKGSRRQRAGKRQASMRQLKKRGKGEVLSPKCYVLSTMDH